jgi:putative membrane protein
MHGHNFEFRQCQESEAVMKGPTRSYLSFKAYLGLAIKGFCMGASDVVPGVSGGTMAFILGIYKELIESIRSFDLVFLKLLFSLKLGDALNHVSWRFLVAVGTGILMAIFSLSRILSWLLQNRPILIWSFFFGLIVASLFTVSRYLEKWTPSIFAWVGLGAACTYFLVGMVPASTPDTPWFLFMSGAIAICAMILPGISGAFILVLLGKYHYVLEAVNNRDFLTLFIVAAGAGVGLISFVRFLNWLLNKYYNFTIAILTGFMLGSLRKVWPWKKSLQSMTDTHGNVIVTAHVNILPNQWSAEVIQALCLAVLGFLIVFFMDFLAERRRHTVV